MKNKRQHKITKRIDNRILRSQDAIVKQAWKLYDKIGGDYQHRSYAWADMVELGRIATQLVILETARSKALFAPRPAVEIQREALEDRSI